MSDGMFTQTSIPMVLATFNAYDQDAVDLYSHASGYAVILWEIQNYIRARIEYAEKITDEARKELTDLQAYIGELEADHHLPPR